MRTEQEIFDELAVLCATPGYVHVIAYFCFRDNIIAFADELKGEDYAKLYSRERLIRTEISTLLGLLARTTIDFSIPHSRDFQAMADRTEALLRELHSIM